MPDGPSEPHLWLVFKLPPRTWEGCRWVVERKRCVANAWFPVRNRVTELASSNGGYIRVRRTSAPELPGPAPDQPGPSPVPTERARYARSAIAPPMTRGVESAQKRSAEIVPDATRRGQARPRFAVS